MEPSHFDHSRFEYVPLPWSGNPADVDALERKILEGWRVHQRRTADSCVVLRRAKPPVDVETKAGFPVSRPPERLDIFKSGDVPEPSAALVVASDQNSGIDRGERHPAQGALEAPNATLTRATLPVPRPRLGAASKRADFLASTPGWIWVALLPILALSGIALLRNQGPWGASGLQDGTTVLVTVVGSIVNAGIWLLILRWLSRVRLVYIAPITTVCVLCVLVVVAVSVESSPPPVGVPVTPTERSLWIQRQSEQQQYQRQAADLRRAEEEVYAQREELETERRALERDRSQAGQSGASPDGNDLKYRGYRRPEWVPYGTPEPPKNDGYSPPSYRSYR